jgi:hypothetical protein
MRGGYGMAFYVYKNPARKCISSFVSIFPHLWLFTVLYPNYLPTLLKTLVTRMKEKEEQERIYNTRTM